MRLSKPIPSVSALGIMMHSIVIFSNSDGVCFSSLLTPMLTSLLHSAELLAPRCRGRRRPMPRGPEAHRQARSSSLGVLPVSHSTCVQRHSPPPIIPCPATLLMLCTKREGKLSGVSSVKTRRSARHEWPCPCEPPSARICGLTTDTAENTAFHF